MFVVGGAGSVEGINALMAPPALEYFWVGVGVLLVALLLDGLSRVVAVRQLRAEARRRGISMHTFLRESPDPALTTVYLEDSVDVIGALLALIALVLHKTTGAEWPDAIATILIEARPGSSPHVWQDAEIAELITNEAVPPRYVERLRDGLERQAGIATVARVEAVYLGASQVLVAADVLMESGLGSERRCPGHWPRPGTWMHREAPVIARLYSHARPARSG